MTILYCSGFDDGSAHYNVDLFTSDSLSTTTADLDFGRYFNLAGTFFGGDVKSRIIIPEVNEIYFSYRGATYPANLTLGYNEGNIFSFGAGDTNFIFGLFLTRYYFLNTRRGGDRTDTLIETDNGCNFAYYYDTSIMWQPIRGYYKPHPSIGRFVLYMGNVKVFDYTGNTSSSSTTIDRFVINSEFGPFAFRFDSLILATTEAEAYGQRVAEFKVTANGDYVEWSSAPSGSALYTNIDEIPVDRLTSNDDQIVSNVSNTKALFLTGDMAEASSIVDSVYVKAAGGPEDSAPDVKLLLEFQETIRESDIVTLFSRNNTLRSSYTKHLWSQNIATSASWTHDDVNDTQIGVKAE